jgi:amino acid transporter
MGGGAIIVVLTLFGFLTQAIQQSFNCFIGGSRILVAMSMDRLLPDGIGKISRRFRGSPVNAILFLLIGAEVLAIVLWFVPNLENFALSTSLEATIYQSITCLAAAVFPFKAKAIYEASPIAKYKVGNIPLITICGGWGFLVGLVLVTFYLIEPNLGLASTAGLYGMLAVYVLSFIWFWIVRAQNAKKGIDVDLNFKQIPPE